MISPPPLFGGLSEEEANTILARAVTRRFKAGAVLCRQGAPAARLYLMHDGRVKFVRTTVDGHDVIMRWLGPGDCFGIGSLLAGPVSYMGTAEAVGEGRVTEWDADAIQKSAVEYPRLAQNALTVVLHYLKEYGDRHLALLSASAEQRLAHTLTHLGATSGQVLSSGVEIAITNRDLGALADVGMYTVSRQLSQWERDGHLVKQRQRILVRHPEGLLRE